MVKKLKFNSQTDRIKNPCCNCQTRFVTDNWNCHDHCFSHHCYKGIEWEKKKFITFGEHELYVIDIMKIEGVKDEKI